MTEKRSNDRDYYFDNAKFILIALVVFGHFIQPFISKNWLLEDLYYFIFTFHMPSFIFISGYFSKKYQEPYYLLKVTKKLLFPYLMFQILYSIFYACIGLSNGFNFKLLVPEWSLWFLLSMFFWQLSLFLFGKLSPFLGILLSIIMSGLVGYVPFIGQELSISRTLVFLPFFLIGHYTTPRAIQIVRSRLSKLIAIGLFFLVALLVEQNDQMNKYWVFGSLSYDHFLENPSLGFIVRLYIYSLSFLAMLAFFIIIPKYKLFFSRWGRNTLYTYLLHGFLIKALRAADISSIPLTSFSFFILFILSISVSIILSTNRVAKICQPVMEYQKFYTLCYTNYQKFLQ